MSGRPHLVTAVVAWQPRGRPGTDESSDVVLILTTGSLTDTAYVALGGLRFAAIRVAQGLLPPIVQYTRSELP